MKILVVDDHALVREGLRQVLKGLDENVGILQAGTCAEAFEQVRAHPNLDLILLDYRLPDMTGLAALEIFGQSNPEIPVVMLSGSANVQIMRQVMQAGAAGFITKSSVSEELLGAIRKVLDGEVYRPIDLGSRGERVQPDGPPGRLPLTRRQELVLDGLLNGKSNREISEALFVSEETVKTHVTAILRHFDVQNRPQAVVAASRTGYRSTTPG